MFPVTQNKNLEPDAVEFYTDNGDVIFHFLSDRTRCGVSTHNWLTDEIIDCRDDVLCSFLGQVVERSTSYIYFNTNLLAWDAQAIWGSRRDADVSSHKEELLSKSPKILGRK